MKQTVYYNGAMLPAEEAKMSIFDHAHLYGDGLFEGIRLYDGLIFKLDEHLDRLYSGIRAMGINMPLSQADYKQVIIDTARAADAHSGSGYIRLNVTRGTGLGLDPKNIDATANVMALVSQLRLYPQEMYEKGLDVVTLSYRMVPPQCMDGRLKSIGRYCANILAKLEANRQGAGEGLMLTVDGFVAECTGDNLFVVKDGALHTPPVHIGILNGITRQTVINLAKQLGIPVYERMMTLFDIYSADEVFLTGTAAEVISTCLVDGKTIGDGKAGAVTHKIIRAFREITQTNGAKI